MVESSTEETLSRRCQNPNRLGFHYKQVPISQAISMLRHAEGTYEAGTLEDLLEHNQGRLKKEALDKAVLQLPFSKRCTLTARLMTNTLIDTIQIIWQFCSKNKLMAGTILMVIASIWVVAQTDWIPGLFNQKPPVSKAYQTSLDSASPATHPGKGGQKHHLSNPPYLLNGQLATDRVWWIPSCESTAGA